MDAGGSVTTTTVTVSGSMAIAGSSKTMTSLAPASGQLSSI
jgi:hypothetical protein